MYILRGHRLYFPGNLVIRPLTIILANNADPDEMTRYVAFHQGFLCLASYSFWGSWSSMS